MPTEEIAVLAGGCFWCLEAVYQELDGVRAVESGYTGGRIPDPTYEQVCGGSTGHAEAVRITFDPEVVSYRDILNVFFAIHDPTTLNRQGNDAGTQYRSAIFWQDERQRTVAEELIAELNAEKIWPAPIVTELKPAAAFYEAEEYHQNYYRNHPGQSYCSYVVAPKLAKFREKFARRMRQRT